MMDVTTERIMCEVVLWSLAAGLLSACVCSSLLAWWRRRRG